MNWKSVFLKKKEKNSYSKNNQFSEFNREVIINQEEQKLNEIEQLKKRLTSLKDELAEVGKIDSKSVNIDETEVITKAYNNSDYYINQVNELDNQNEKIDIQKINQNIDNDLFNEDDDTLEENDLNFKIPYNVDEVDSADEDLILPSYESINSQDI